MKRKIMLIICSLVLTLSSVLPGFAAECVADKADEECSRNINSNSPYHAMMTVENDIITHACSVYTVDQLKQVYSLALFL